MTRPRVRAVKKKAVKKETVKKETAKPVARSVSDGLEGVSFHLGRAYYRYIALVESGLREAGLAERVRPGMGHVLFALFEKDDRVIKEIVERADVSPSTLTGILLQMEKQGLVERRADPQDGRAVRVRLTRRAKALEERLRKIQVRVHKVMYADLTADELLAVKQGLARMTSAMREHETSQEQGTRSRSR